MGGGRQACAECFPRASSFPFVIQQYKTLYRRLSAVVHDFTPCPRLSAIQCTSTQWRPPAHSSSTPSKKKRLLDLTHKTDQIYLMSGAKPACRWPREPSFHSDCKSETLKYVFNCIPASHPLFHTLHRSSSGSTVDVDPMFAVMT